jgi:hypothetical protein
MTLATASAERRRVDGFGRWTRLVADVIRRHRAYPPVSQVIQRFALGEYT